jgi:predicted transcriptional regulator
MELSFRGESVAKRIIVLVRDNNLKDFTLKQLSEALGVKASAVAVSIGTLVKKNAIIKTAPGVYNLTTEELVLKEAEPIWKYSRKNKAATEPAPAQEEKHE